MSLILCCQLWSASEQWFWLLITVCLSPQAHPVSFGYFVVLVGEFQEVSAKAGGKKNKRSAFPALNPRSCFCWFRLTATHPLTSSLRCWGSSQICTPLAGPASSLPSLPAGAARVFDAGRLELVSSWTASAGSDPERRSGPSGASCGYWESDGARWAQRR